MTHPYLNNDVATMKKSRLWQVGNTSHCVQDVAPCRRQTSNIIGAGVSMHKSPTPVRGSRMNQARSDEEEKERTIVMKDRGQEDDGKIKSSPTKQKLSEELKQGLKSLIIKL